MESRKLRPFLVFQAAAVSCFLFVPDQVTWAQENPVLATRPRHAIPPDLQPDIPEDVLRINTDLIVVDTNVTNSAGRPVHNLKPDDFKLFEDGERRPVAFLDVEKKTGVRRPISVVFALDVSGSMTPEEMERLGGAMRTFSQHLADRSSFFAVMTFGMNVRILQPLTNDPRKLNRAFDRLPHEVNGLSTHAYGAVDDAIRLLARHTPKNAETSFMKRAVIVVTDGFPVGDTISPSTVIERANAEGVSVYTVTLPSYSRFLIQMTSKRTPLPTPLDVSGLVEKTGGTGVYATEKDYEPLFKALAEEVTSNYVLAFYPPGDKRRDGKVHSIKVEGPPGLQIHQNRFSYKAERGEPDNNSKR